MEFCEIGDLTHRFRGPGGGLSLYSCLVSGSVLTEVEFVGAGSGSGGARDSREYQRGRGLSHNTILGDLTLCCAATVRSNVVSGRAELFGGDGYVISHNDFVGGLVVTSPGDSVYANISEPPLFCNPAGGDYTLQDCSPCVGAAHDGGDIGAFGVDCECMVVVEHKSWGAVKAMYR